MENTDPNLKDLPEKNQATNDLVQSMIEKRTLIEEKFNQVNEKLEKLKVEADKLLHPQKP